MNYVELHIGDYDKATAHLTACEDGIYGRLLRRYYDTEAPLPLDLKAVQRLVRARARDEREAVATVLEEFFEQTAEGWRHSRCDAEIAKYQEKRSKAKRSAEARWNAPNSGSERNANASANAMRTHSDGNAHQTPDASHQSPHEGLTTAPPLAAGSVDPPVERVGQFEGHAVPFKPTPNPVAAFAIALGKAGVPCTAMNPDLIAYVAEGGTVEDLAALARTDGFVGKPATYVIRAARRMLAEAAQPITGATRHENRSRSGNGIRPSLADQHRADHERRAGGRSEPAPDDAIDGTAVRIPT